MNQKYKLITQTELVSFLCQLIHEYFSRLIGDELDRGSMSNDKLDLLHETSFVVSKVPETLEIPAMWSTLLVLPQVS